MAITYKDINLLSQKASVAGTEKLPVSDTEYITPAQITSGLATDSGVVHTTGNETIAGSKTFSNGVIISGSLTANGGISKEGSTGFGWIEDDDNTTLQDALDAKQATLVSGTNIKTINDSSILGSGNLSVTADTSSCVHLTGDETIADDKTFTDNIGVVDADHILYSGGGGGGFTKAYASATGGGSSLAFTVANEPKAFVIVSGDLHDGGTTSSTGTIAIVGDSTGCHGVYSANSTHQHNYSSGYTASYSNGTLTVTCPAGVSTIEEDYFIVYYYGSGTLTFKTSTFSPGSGVTSATFTGTGLTEVPAMYACFLESAVNSESYRRVAVYTNSGYSGAAQESLGVTFYSSQLATTTSSFSVSYNNGLVINSGGMNAGGYFHNPGTYTLYYLMASDIGGGGGGAYSSLGDELDDIRSSIPSDSLPSVSAADNGDVLAVVSGSWAKKDVSTTYAPYNANGYVPYSSGNSVGLESSNNGWSLSAKNANAIATLAHYSGSVATFGTKLSGTSDVLAVKSGQTTLGTGGTTILSMDASGNATFNGTLTHQGNVPVRKITISSSEPTSGDGNNGDIWIVI